jgi:alpha-glucosidase
VAPGTHPFTDRDGIHDIYRAWRRVADSYDPPRVLVGEIWLPDVARFAAYLEPGEMHTAFNFDFMTRPWEAAALRDSIDTTLLAHAGVVSATRWVWWQGGGAMAGWRPAERRQRRQRAQMGLLGS